MPPTDTPIPAGLATYLGLAGTLAGALGAVVAAAAGNDVATVTAGTAGILATLTTIGGRMAQAIAAIRAAALVAEPWIDAVQEALADEPGNDAALAGQGILTEDLGEHA